MRLATYRHSVHGPRPHAGVIQGDRILNAARLLGSSDEPSLLALLARPDAIAELRKAAEQFAADFATTIHVPREFAVASWEAELLPPVLEPPSIRDFYAFEAHVAAGYRARGRDVPRAWYEVPVFYYAHTGNLFGADAAIPMPPGTIELDFELELAAVIGAGGRDIQAADAWNHIVGFTIMNDWSARDIQRQESSVGLGPAKGKDFATSFGPALVTIDELRDRIEGDSISLAMIARINGEECSRDNTASMQWGFPKLIERASQNVELRPGDIIGSGTCGTGCLLELGQDHFPWLQPGDEVELEIERIGRLRSTIAAT